MRRRPFSALSVAVLLGAPCGYARADEARSDSRIALAIGADIEPLGSATRALAGRVLAALCSPDVAASLARTCAVSDPATVALKVALLEDVARLAGRATSSSVPHDDASLRAEHTMAAFGALVEGRSPAGVAEALANKHAPGGRKSARLAAALLRRLESGTSSDPDAALDEALSEAVGDARTAPTAEQRAAAARLAESSRKARALAGALRAAAPPMQISEATSATSKTVAEAGALADSLGGERSGASWNARSLELASSALKAAFARSMTDAVNELAPALERLEDAHRLPGGVTRAVRISARIADARSEDDVQRLARETLVPLPPWTEHWLAEINGSIPVLESKDFRANGDLLLGHARPRWGIVARGSAYDYESVRPSGIDDTTRYDGEASAWAGFPLSARTQLQIRGAFGASLYDTTTATAATVTNFVDETSIIGRGELLAGIRHVVDRFALAAEAGGGLQVESWDGNAAAISGGRIQYTNTDQSPVEARGTGRLRGQWNIVPDLLALRARIDGNYVAITRSAVTTTAGTGAGATTIADVSSSHQIEIFARGFVDLDALRLFGFRPAAHGGVNLVSVEGDAHTVAVFGAGIVREAF